MRVWVFRIITAIVLPVVLIVATEGSLRLLNVGYPSELTVPCTVRDLNAFCDNDHFTWQFFPPGAFRLPPAFAIPAQKPPESFRIFIVGEFAAQGDPEPAYSFGRYLEVMLRERFPAIRFEVVNTGIAAINSHVLLPAVRNLARRDGDLFVLYIGNNEVVGPYGAATALTRRGGSLGLIRAGIFLNSTRIGQLLRAAFHYGDSDSYAWRGMEMFLMQQVPAHSTDLRLVYAHFRSNLRDIISVARGSAAHVLISTVGVNLKDSAPFASLHRPDLTSEKKKVWESTYVMLRSWEGLGGQARRWSAIFRLRRLMTAMPSSSTGSAILIGSLDSSLLPLSDSPWPATLTRCAFVQTARLMKSSALWRDRQDPAWNCWTRRTCSRKLAPTRCQGMNSFTNMCI